MFYTCLLVFNCGGFGDAKDCSECPQLYGSPSCAGINCGFRKNNGSTFSCVNKGNIYSK